LKRTSAYPENPSRNESGKPAEINAARKSIFLISRNQLISEQCHDADLAMGYTMTKRAAIYVRVSTDKQTVENQVKELRQIAERRGWEVVEQYNDAGISGSKGRDGRPGLDRMLKDASKRRFDVVMAWAIDRLGRSLIDLLGTIQTLEASGADLYLDQQSIDTTTPAGKLMFQVTGAFAEFERSMIRQRVRARA
jgi:DNA invertase Pin-like site-specific DNA recombinase